MVSAVCMCCSAETGVYIPDGRTICRRESKHITSGPLKPYTGGCVAVPENIMKLILQQVQPDCVVVIDTLENMHGSF